MEPIRGAEAQLRHFLNTLMTPDGFVVALLFLGLTVLMFAYHRPLKWPVLVLLLVASMLGISYSPWFDNTLTAPLEQIRRHSTGMTAAALGLLLIPTVLSDRGWRWQLILGGTVFLLIFQLVYSGRMIFEGHVARGIGGAVLFFLVFMGMGLGLSRWLQGWNDVHAVIRCVVVAGAVLILGVAYQLTINPSAIIHHGRLFALSSNPQHAAVLCALMLPFACYTVVRPGEANLWRLFAGAVAGFLAIFLLWTGSRTGALMALVGLGLLFRARIGKLLGAGIVGGAFVLLALMLFGEAGGAADRVLSTADTRSHVWRSLITDFVASPVWGTIRGAESQILENSYLSAAARLGLIGVIPLALCLIYVGAAVRRLRKSRQWLGEQILLADLVTAGLAALAVGAMFEGYLFSTLFFPIFCIYLNLALLAFLLDAIACHQAAYEEAEPLLEPQATVAADSLVYGYREAY